MDNKLFWPPKQRYRNPKVYTLNPEDELLIYEIQDFIRVRLLDGNAEVFGRELPNSETVFFFRGQNIAIFTWKGAKIEIEVFPEFMSKNIIQDQRSHGEIKNPMRELVNLNHILEQLRQQSLMMKKPGPRVFVTGNS